MIALPNLSVEIDEDIIDLLFSNPRYISDDDNISIQKIYELNYDENHQHRLVVILYTHSEGKIYKAYKFLSKKKFIM